LGYSLSADSNITDLLQGEHPYIFAGIGEGYRKSGFWCTKALISLKRGKIGPRVLYWGPTATASHTRFRLVPKSMTLDDFEGSLCTLFQNTFAMVLLFIYFQFHIQSDFSPQMTAGAVAITSVASICGEDCGGPNSFFRPSFSPSFTPPLPLPSP